MNYRPIAVSKFSELVKEFPDYTLGELLHSIKLEVGKSGKDLLSISDEEIYTVIEKVIEFEKE